MPTICFNLPAVRKLASKNLSLKIVPCKWKTYLHLIEQGMPIEISYLLASCVIPYSCIVDPDALARNIFLQEYFWREPVLIVFAIIDRSLQ